MSTGFANRCDSRRKEIDILHDLSSLPAIVMALDNNAENLG